MLYKSRAFFFFFVKFILRKVATNNVTSARQDAGRPPATVVTPYLLLSAWLVAGVAPGLTGGVVAVRRNWVAAVQTTCADVSLVQNWTLHS